MRALKSKETSSNSHHTERKEKKTDQQQSRTIRTIKNGKLITDSSHTHTCHPTHTDAGLTCENRRSMGKTMYTKLWSIPLHNQIRIHFIFRAFPHRIDTHGVWFFSLAATQSISVLSLRCWESVVCGFSVSVVCYACAKFYFNIHQLFGIDDRCVI